MTTYNSGIYSTEELQTLADSIENIESLTSHLEIDTNDWQLSFDMLSLKTKKELLILCPDIADYEGNSWKKEDYIKHLIQNQTKHVAPAAHIPTQKANKMKKLNKNQIWEQVQAVIKASAMAKETELRLSDGQIEMVTNLLSSILAPKSGGGTSDKVNDDGEVYCNYFKLYYPESNFDTKQTKADRDGNRKTVFKASCKAAEKIQRKVKTLKTSVTSMVMSEFRAKRLEESDMTEILDKLDAALAVTYGDIEEVPTAAVIVGLV